MNEKDLVTFEQAKKLKELGFDWKCLYHYYGDKIFANDVRAIDVNTNGCFRSNNSIDINNRYYDAPFLYQVQNWLREEKNIYITIDTYYPNWASNDWTLTYECIIIYLDKHLRDYLTYRPSTYEEALNAGINKVLEEL